MRKSIYKICLITCTVLFGCSTLNRLTQEVYMPLQAEMSAPELYRLTYEQANFLLNIRMKNANATTVKLTGYEYEISLPDTVFICRSFHIARQISPESVYDIKLPFQILHKSLGQKVNANKAEFKIKIVLKFSAGFKGLAQEVQLEQFGVLPLPCLPELSVESLHLNSIQVSDAEMTMFVKFVNPNIFDFTLTRFYYTLSIEKNVWKRYDFHYPILLKSESERMLRLPMKVDFFEKGFEVFRLLNEERPYHYGFEGGIVVSPELLQMQSTSFRFMKEGVIKPVGL